MNIKTVWAVYFSGTGTTEKVATTLAKDLAERLGAGYDTYCFNLPQAREKDLSFGPEDLVVLGTPVYAGRVPNLLMPYVRDHIKGNGTLGVPVVLYGNRNYDDGLIELRNLMRDNGFMPVAAGAFVGVVGRSSAQSVAYFMLSIIPTFTTIVLALFFFNGLIIVLSDWLTEGFTAEGAGYVILFSGVVAIVNWGIHRMIWKK